MIQLLLRRPDPDCMGNNSQSGWGKGGEGVRMRMEKKGREVGRKVGHTKGEVNRGVWAIFKMVNRILT